MMLLLALTFSLVASQDDCVSLVFAEIGANNIAALSNCFGNITYSYDPTTCALESRAEDYCSDGCQALMITAIKSTFKYNCTNEVVASIQMTSPYTCDPFGASPKACPDPTTQACIARAVNDTIFYCVPIYAANCTTPYSNCSTCPYATVCVPDLANNLHPTCILIDSPTADVFNDYLGDVYFYLGQTYCQESDSEYCSDLVYEKPTALTTCSDVDDWGMCAGSYLDLATNCENPVTDRIMSLHATCSNSSAWNMTFSGAATGANCCNMPQPCNLSGGAGTTIPSILLLSVLMFLKLVV